MADRRGRAGRGQGPPSHLREDGARVSRRSPRPLMAADPRFAHETVQEGVNDGYWVMPIDVDGDGRPDLVTSGLALGEVAWFRNPDWRRRVIGKFSRPISLDQADIDGDGHTDLVVCHDYAPTMFEATPQDGHVSWLRNAGERDEPWQVRPIGQ